MGKFDEIVDEKTKRLTRDILKKVDKDVINYDFKYEKYNDLITLSKEDLEKAVMLDVVLLKHPNNKSPERKYELLLAVIHGYRMCAALYKLDFEKKLNEDLK